MRAHADSPSMSRPQLDRDPAGNAPDSAARAAPASRRVLGMRVDATSYAETAETVLELAARGAGGMVCVATAHMVIEALDDAEFRGLVNSADRVTPDGMSLVWALHRLGLGRASRVYGPLLMPEICARAAARGVPVGLYGGSPEVLEALQARLRARFPGLALPFAFSPPFRELDADEDARVVEAVVASGARVLFVGLGCPRQERWMAAHRAALPCALVGVGAAFDFLAGAKPQAPPLLQGAGLEWLFRLACEPRRLWRRYLIGNARFLFHFALRGSGD
jgi:N-acetylglucosaminyldiphosphoundecaprenol N-acetyl-beta-D-mannosaminyltransferase